MVDATAGHKLLSFMNAYSGHNQIKMHPRDKDKIAFTIDRVIYCYRFMPYGLKNIGVTFQRMVNEVFKELIRFQVGATFQLMVNEVFKEIIGNTMDLYVDEICL